MNVFQISSTNHFGERIIFRRKDEEVNDKQLSYTELVIQGIHGRGYESNRNDLELVFEKTRKSFSMWSLLIRIVTMP